VIIDTDIEQLLFSAHPRMLEVILISGEQHLLFLVGEGQMRVEGLKDLFLSQKVSHGSLIPLMVKQKGLGIWSNGVQRCG